MMDDYGEYEEYEDDEEYEENEQEATPRKKSDLVLGLTGGTLVTTEILGAMLHGGALGVGAGLLASAFVYLKGQDMLDAAQEILPLPAPSEKTRQARRGGRSFKDRLLGNYPEEEPLATSRHQPRKAGRNWDKIYSEEASALLVQLAPDLAVDVDEIAAKAIFIVGQRRSGKTTLGARLAEELGGHYIPMLVPCVHGDYLSMIDILPRGVVASAPGSQEGADYYVEPTTVHTAQALGYKILDAGLQVIVDMASYATIGEACQVVTQIIAGMFAWSQRHPGSRVPCEVFLDEAQALLPQDLSESVITDRETLKGFLKAYMGVVGEGGKFGLSPVILSQRFAQTNKKLIAQAEVRFILRQTGDNDLERCMDYVNKTTATREQIAAFKQGQGIYIGADGTQLVTRFSLRHSDGSRSHTPKAAQAQRYAGMPMPAPGSGMKTGHSQRPERPGRLDDAWTPRTPRLEPTEQHFDERPGRPDVAPHPAPDEHEAGESWDVRTLPEVTGTPHAEPPDAIGRQRPNVPDQQYRLSEREIQQFVSAYRACGSVDKALATLKRGARYRAHANEILTTYGLRQNQ